MPRRRHTFLTVGPTEAFLPKNCVSFCDRDSNRRHPRLGETLSDEVPNTVETVSSAKRQDSEPQDNQQQKSRASSHALGSVELDRFARLPFVAREVPHFNRLATSRHGLQGKRINGTPGRCVTDVDSSLCTISDRFQKLVDLYIVRPSMPMIPCLVCEV